MHDEHAAPDPSLDGFEFPVPPGFDEMHAQMHQRFKQPDWMCEPFNWLPGVVAMEHVAARTDGAVVQLAALRAFATGFSFQLRAVLREPDHAIDNAMFGHPGMHAPGGALPDGLLRIAFAYADGSTASSLGMFGPGPMGPGGEPAGPTMMQGGGGGGGGNYTWDYWCWPLPPAGVVRVICEWPAAGIQREVTEFDAQVILDAAARAERLWDDPPEPPTEWGQHSVRVN